MKSFWISNASCAIWIQKILIIDLLIQFGVNVEARNNLGETGFIIACRCGHFEIINLLLEHGADPNAKIGEENMILFNNSLEKHLQIARLLIENNASLNMQNGNGY